MALVKQLIRKQVFAIKAEATQFSYNWSASAPITADLLPCAGPVSYTPKFEVIKNETLISHFGHLDDKPTYGTVEFKGKCYINPSGAAGTAPLISALMQAGGFKETIVGATSVTYKPSADATTANTLLNKSFSVMLIEDGYAYGGSGCQASELSFIFEAGKPCMLEFTLVGAYQAVAAKTAPALPSTLPTGIVFYNAGTSIVPSWTTPEFRKWQLNIKNTMADQIDANFATNYGYKGAQISFREITGSVDPTFDPSNYDVFAALVAGTTGAMSTGTLGTGAGNLMKWTIGRAMYNGAPGFEDRGGFRAHSWPFQVTVAANAADGDDCSLQFT